MKRRLLLILAAVQRPGNEHYRLIKYSELPPLSLLTIAGLTPDGWEITVRDEHVESSEVVASDRCARGGNNCPTKCADPLRRDRLVRDHRRLAAGVGHRSRPARAASRWRSREQASPSAAG